MENKIGIGSVVFFKHREYKNIKGQERIKLLNKLKNGEDLEEYQAINLYSNKEVTSDEVDWSTWE
ncbi:MAG: hypothetical protein EOM67_11750 [Spirochaetia bacterium]|nr:hypothetical protein [Spirochaetia bacterium]